MSIRRIPLALAAALVLAAPAGVAAAETQTTSTGVKYKDLDLTTDAGQKELAARLDRAARAVCGMDEVGTGTRVKSRDARDCYREAREQLGEQISRVTKGGAQG